MCFSWFVWPVSILREEGPSWKVTTAIQFQITVVINLSTNCLRNLDSKVNVWFRFCANISHGKIEEILSGWELNRAIGDQYKSKPSCCFSFDFSIQFLAITTVSLYCLSSGSIIITGFHSWRGNNSSLIDQASTIGLGPISLSLSPLRKTGLGW